MQRERELLEAVRRQNQLLERGVRAIETLAAAEHADGRGPCAVDFAVAEDIRRRVDDEKDRQGDDWASPESKGVEGDS